MGEGKESEKEWEGGGMEGRRSQQHELSPATSMTKA